MITIDFILVLSILYSNKDYLFTIIYKYIKKVILIFDKTIYFIVNYIKFVIINLLIYNKYISLTIISDRDRKFILLF